MPEKLYDVKQLQEVLGLSERTIFRLLREGDLTGFKAGREWRFTQGDIDMYIESQRRKAGEKRRRERKLPHNDGMQDVA
ncbi:MAG: helix-turn-helix domain-containing protein [Ktedonobacteraceae bacterium]